MNLDFYKFYESKGHNSPVYCLSDYKQGQILSGGGEGWIAKWSVNDPENGHLVARIESSVFALYYCDDLSMIIAGDRHGGIHWIFEDGKVISKVVHDAEIYKIDRFENFIYTLDRAGWLTKWGVNSQKAVESLHLGPFSLRSFVLQADLRNALIGAGNGKIYVVDLDEIRVKNDFQVHSGTVFALACDEKFNIISGGKDAHIKLWKDGDFNAPSKDIPAHWFSVYAIKKHPSLPVIASCSRDKTIRIWYSETIEPILTLDYGKIQGHTRSVNDIIWSEDGKFLISAGDDCSIIFWQLEHIL